MFKVNNKETRTTPMALFWCLYCYLWTYFTPCSSVSIVNFEHVNADWEVNHWVLFLRINHHFSSCFENVNKMFRKYDWKSSCLAKSQTYKYFQLPGILSELFFRDFAVILNKIIKTGRIGHTLKRQLFIPRNAYVRGIFL